MISIKTSLLFLASVSLAIFPVCDGKVLMEYIGATGVPVSFNNVPINPEIDFHFILGFAIDTDPSGKPHNDKCSPNWISSITLSSVRSIKSRHSKVKVLAGLSGWSIGEKVVHLYNPSDPEAWISNAYDSLRSIITKYPLDGIDINYETFPKNETTFIHCIGELMTRLKSNDVVAVATIAPYYLTAKFYILLYRSYQSVIDYVNHQFYTDKVASPESFLHAFKPHATQFYGKKLLPSYEVDGRGIQGDAFFEALKLIERSGLQVNEVMIFSADGSKSNGFYYEKQSQASLLNQTIPS